ncbi:unnamed protein product, partial [Meganyctiphanes norvegica]
MVETLVHLLGGQQSLIYINLAKWRYYNASCYNNPSQRAVNMGFSQAIVLVSVCIIVLPACYAFSGLDVTLACNTMTPGHLAFGGAQRSTAPYQITTKNNNDGTLDVIVNGDEFKGFLLQARNAGGKRVGVFTPTAKDSRAIDCDYQGGAIQHNNGDDKRQVIVKWNPGNFQGRVQFRLTVVKGYTTFWTDIKSNVFTI